MAHYPETVQLVLEDYDRVTAEEMRLSEIISGFADSEEEAPPASIGSMLDESQQEVIIEEPLIAVDEDEEGGDGSYSRSR